MKLPNQADSYDKALAASFAPVRIHDHECHVLYLDVLGFRDKVEKDQAKTFERMVGMRAALRSLVEHRHSFSDVDRTTVVGFTKVSAPIVFSDSVFACTRDNSAEALEQLCHVANMLVRYLVLHGMVARGGIATGPLHWDEPAGVHLGIGLNRAVELAESLNVLGIAIDPRVPQVRTMLGPFPVQLRKIPGTASLRVPGTNAALGVSYDSMLDRYEALEAQELASGKLDVMAKFEASREIMRAMMGPLQSFDLLG